MEQEVNLPPFAIIKKVNKKNHCPFCNSRNISIMNTSSTMVAIQALNHIWKRCKCNNCNEHFIIEQRDNKIWYTKDMLVLEGEPNCFENYNFKCQCGGKIFREYYDLKNNKAKILCYDSIKGAQYYTVYKCDTCELEYSPDKEDVLRNNK